MTDVPVTEASSVDLALGRTGFAATLGLVALKRLDMIIDAVHGTAYLRMRNEKAPPYKHSRMGVAFLPRDSKNIEFLAHLSTNCPAYRAGIRENDVLLEVDGRKVENAEDHHRISDWIQDLPSCIETTMTLQRGTNVFKTIILLKDILGP